MITQLVKSNKRKLYFLGVGGIAGLVHIHLVFIFVSFLHSKPLLANIVAFLIAFNISFFGHKYLTFSSQNGEKKLSLAYFFIVAISAGLMSESLYFLLLQYTQIHYIVALILVSTFVSIYTFIFSRYWACR